MSESTLRRHANARGLKLVKFPERSSWYLQYGPYTLVDENNVMTEHGMDGDTVRAVIASL